ncbi:TRAP transporter large permease subunit [Chloroflexota bacterium]
MEWQFALLLILGSLLILMLTGLPVAFCFLIVNLVGMFLFFGGLSGLDQLIYSMRDILVSFGMLPIPLFILMGEVMFHSGIASEMISTLDKWLGRLPGRLSLLAVGSGVLFGTLSGSSMSGVAVLGSVLVPEMESRGYKKPMTLGPILGSGTLAMMIPPSTLAVLLGAIAEISIGKIFIAILIPGLVTAILYATYIITRCWLQPSIAPPYKLPPVRLSERLSTLVKHVLPLAVIVFLVIGVIFIGAATPTEAAALGAFGCFILAFLYRRLNWEVVKKSVSGTLLVTVMMFMIMVGSKAFSQILGYSGAGRGITGLALVAPLAPILIVVAMQIVVLIMGSFMDVLSIMMITLPMYIPVIRTLGFNEVWFAVIMLISVEIGVISPPFGTSLFVMKGVAPPDTTMGDVYRGSLTFIGLCLISMALVIIFPQLALWLPGLMR